jgi:FeS assembly protein IscX
MADPVYWDDAYPIALMLNAAHADVGDPSAISLPMLQAWVVALDGFADDRAAHKPEWLENIQAEWVDLK